MDFVCRLMGPKEMEKTPENHDATAIGIAFVVNASRNKVH